MHYLQKKYSRSLCKKYIYGGHSTSAASRLRISGKFITREQAFQILGITSQTQVDNQTIQQMLNKHNQDKRQQITKMQNNQLGHRAVTLKFHAQLESDSDSSPQKKLKHKKNRSHSSDDQLQNPLDFGKSSGNKSSFIFQKSFHFYRDNS